MSNVVSDYVHFFAGMLLGGIVSYVFALNDTNSVKLNINLINQTKEVCESDFESSSQNSANDVVCEDSTSEDETDNDKNEEVEEKMSSANEEEKKDELKLD